MIARPIAPARYIGHQDDAQGGGFALYNLTADIEGHDCGSTVTAATLESAGYRMPDAVCQDRADVANRGEPDG